MDFHRFRLDDFQERAIRGIEQGHSVLVGAPTGSGKTLIAEFAVERSLARGEQVIYTAPIKALSNQKFHDFHAQFGDRVGILTGDVSVNGGADVVVMTTEILRNTMLEEPDRLNKVAYVVFDEIHYVDDLERGTVWEESIILAPKHVAFVCLSATAPNIEEFAAWIRSVHPIPVDVIVETRRSVPMQVQFYAETVGVCDFVTIRRAAALLKARRYDWDRFAAEWEHGASGAPVPRAMPRGHRARRASHHRHRGDETPHVTLRLLDHLVEHDRLPCLFFSPMRRLCETRARYFAEHYRLQPVDRDALLALFDQLCDRYGLLGEPAAVALRSLVDSGVAYHHAGMLPALKQVVERLFATGRIRALFATETFALGINMPARSVVFDGMEKFDGHSMRPLMAREFQQMSGRAGRRGIDERGYVFVQTDLREFVPATVEHAVFGKTEPIDSRFALSYSSILNLYDRFGDAMYDICRRSFAHFQARGPLMDVEERLAVEAGAELVTHRCPHGVPELHLSHKETRRRLVDARRDLARAERALRKAGKEPPEQLQTNAQAARAYFEELKADLDAFNCASCKEAHACHRAARAARKSQKDVRRLQQERGRISDPFEADVRRRFELLRGLGYVTEGGLAPKGRIAAHIFGYEIQVTELMFRGYFERLGEKEMNALVAAITFEGKKAAWYKDLHLRRSPLASAEREVNTLIARERRAGISVGMKPLDLRLTAAVYAWTDGADFSYLTRYTNASDGDLVRAFRLMLDLYRQIKRAVPEDRSLVERINRAIDRLKRPPIDPEWELAHAEEGEAQEQDTANEEAAARGGEGLREEKYDGPSEG